MEVFDRPEPMRAWSHARRTASRRVATVPTMGALHAGHLALIAAARREADDVIVTIFVNRLQFDRADDFDRYPRPLAADVEACRDAGVDAVYTPDSATMYPPGFQTTIVPGELAAQLEGAMRPGHFEGVTTVVAKLLGTTVPDIAVFGQKDYQQLAIVRQMVADLDMGITIVAVPTVRETDGLALSSRNVRLSRADRAAAVAIPRALRAAVDAHAAGERDADALASFVSEQIAAQPLGKLEYVAVVDAGTLTPLSVVDRPAVVLIAAWFGGVRLIDNVLLG